MSSYTIHPVRSPTDLNATITLITAYADWLNLDLSFQDFSTEMANMPGKYTPPTGELLLARDEDGAPIGCVGLRPTPVPGICEMKRLYIPPEGRGRGIGKALVNAVVEVARGLGYKEMKLDTLSSMTAAIGLYRQAGFVVCDAYYENPLMDVVFMTCSLREFSSDTLEMDLMPKT